MSDSALRIVSVVQANRSDQRRGLLAFVIVEIDGLLRIAGVAVRRTKRGELTLSFPERIDAQGVRHAIVCPRNREARRHIESLVFEQLNLAQGAVEDELC